MDAFASQIIAVLLVSLRVGPTLTFAPPFTLLRIPAVVRVLLSVGLAAWMTSAAPTPEAQQLLAPGWLAAALASELLFGIALTLSLQLAFAALMLAGRAIDFQVGFGLALLADPTLRTQMPLIGSLFAYAAGAVFFTTNAPADLLAIWAQSLHFVPIGAFAVTELGALLSYISATFVLGLGIGGFVLLVLFLVDLTIAFLSRTLPQMNVLLLGFQVKTIALLATLPFVFTYSGALFLRMIRLALNATPSVP